MSCNLDAAMTRGGKPVESDVGIRVRGRGLCERSPGPRFRRQPPCGPGAAARRQRLSTEKRWPVLGLRLSTCAPCTEPKAIAEGGATGGVLD